MVNYGSAEEAGHGEWPKIQRYRCLRYAKTLDENLKSGSFEKLVENRGLYGQVTFWRMERLFLSRLIGSILLVKVEIKLLMA